MRITKTVAGHAVLLLCQGFFDGLCDDPDRLQILFQSLHITRSQIDGPAQLYHRRCFAKVHAPEGLSLAAVLSSSARSKRVRVVTLSAWWSTSSDTTHLSTGRLLAAAEPRAGRGLRRR